MRLSTALAAVFAVLAAGHLFAQSPDIARLEPQTSTQPPLPTPTVNPQLITPPAVQPTASGQATSQTTSVVVPAPPPPPLEKKSDESAKFNNLESQFSKSRSETQGAITELNRRVATLTADLKAAQAVKSNFAELIAKTNERIGLLESVNAQRLQGAVDLDQIRYKTGRDLYVLLIKNSGKLKVEANLATNLVDFGAMVNPTTDTNFVKELDSLQGTLDKANKSFVDKLKTSPLMANPYVSIAVSIGSLLVSNYNKDEKVGKLTNIVCTIHFTSHATSDLAFIQDSLKSLDQEIRSYQTATKSHFAAYVATVGYSKDYDAYYLEKQTTGYDPTEKIIDGYFNDLKKKFASTAVALSATPEEIGRVRFQIEAVRSDLQEYERILKHVDDFLSGYVQVLQKNKTGLADLSKIQLCQAYVTTDKQTKLDQLIDGVKQNQKETRDEYLNDIPAASKRVLFGID